MIRQLRFARWLALIFVGLFVLSCEHDSANQRGHVRREPLGEQAHAATLGFPPPIKPDGKKVGTLPGGGGVGPGGDYHYNVPLDVPPGRAGMAPSLSLSYSSTSGNGLLGVGWKLGGLSVIKPCNATFATNGVAASGPVPGYPHSDRKWCLDGEQLIDVTADAHPQSPSDFRTEADSFARIKVYTTDDSRGPPRTGFGFRVWLKDGRIRSYEIPRSNSYEVNEAAMQRHLLVSEVDRDGNSITYDYKQLFSPSTSATDEFVPAKITYTGRTSTGDLGARQVVFNYDDDFRPDILYGYDDPPHQSNVPTAFGHNTLHSLAVRRLISIDCNAPTPTAGAPEGNTASATSLVWTYTFGYATSATSGRTLLKSVKRSGAQGSENYAKLFTWTETKGGFDDQQTLFVSRPAPPEIAYGDPTETMVAVDVDNDGKDELLVRPPPLPGIPLPPTLYSTTSSADVLGDKTPLVALMGATLTDARISDLDGDGIPEIIAPSAFADQAGTRTYDLYTWSAALREYEKTALPTPAWANYIDSSSSGAEQPIYLADMDGDGLADLIQARIQGGHDPTCVASTTPERPRCLRYSWYYSPNDGFGGFAPPPRPFLTSERGVYRAPLSGSPFASLIVPDRSGRTTLVASAEYDNGNGPGALIAMNEQRVAGVSTLAIEATSVSSNPLCGFGDFFGRGGYDQECFDLSSLQPPSIFTAKDWRVAVLDYDLDGRDDLIAYVKGYTIATGAFATVGNGYLVRYDIAGKRHQDVITKIPLVLGDFNGDGIRDAYLYDSSIGYASLALQTAPTRDLLVAVGDESAPRPSEVVSYSQRWWLGTRATVTCAHPLRCLRSGMNVVTEHDVYQGADLDAYKKHIYSYDDPRYDVQGRGFLGFATVRQWNPDRPSETITTYDNGATALGGLYQAFLPTVVRHYVPTDPLPFEESAQPYLKTANVRISETRAGYSNQFTNGILTHFNYLDSWQSDEWESVANIDMTPGIPRHFADYGAKTKLRTRTGTRSVDHYGNETYRAERTEGGVSSEVKTEYNVLFEDWLLRQVKTTWTTVTKPGGVPPTPRRVDYGYDALGHLTTVDVEKSSLDPDIRSTATLGYTPDGLVNVVTLSAPGETPRTKHTDYDPDEGIFPRREWNDLGHTSWSLYHPAFGALVNSIDVNGVATQVILDDLGRPRERKHASGATEYTSYSPRKNDNGNLIGAYVDTSGTGLGAARSTLDSLGRVVTEQHEGFDGNPILKRKKYDLLGRLIFSSRPGAFNPSLDGTWYSHDPMNRLRAITAPDQSTVTLKPTFWQTDTYGPGQAVAGFAPAHSYVVRDVDGRVVESTQLAAQGAKITTTFAYGDFNELLTVTDPMAPKANVTTMVYDHLGRRKRLLDPDSGASAFYYNGFGELTKTEAPSVEGSAQPVTTRYARDVLGRVKQIDNADGTSTTSTWDTNPHGIGQIAHRSSPEGTTEDFTYDTLGRLSHRTWTVEGEPFEVITEYDKSGAPSRISYPNVPGKAERFVVQRSYRHGYLRKVGPFTPPGQPSAAPFWTVDARNADDYLVQGTSGNQTRDVRTYDPTTGRLATIVDSSNAINVPVMSLAYTYWADGSVKSRIDGPRGRTETFDHGDGLGRLTGWHLVNGAAPAHDVGYHYDPIGNLDQVTVNSVVTEKNTPDPKLPHALGTRVTSAGQSSFQYDARGRQIQTPTRKVTFTDHDLPKTVTTAAGDTKFLYDATGARVKKTEPNGSSTVTLGGLYERRKNGSTTEHIFLVPGSDGNLAQITYDETTATETHAYIHPDALGSTGSVSDNFKGVKRFDHEPFGQRIAPSGAAFAGAAPSVRLGFTGHAMDDDLGLVNMKGRIYDPAQRRFLSPDPFIARPLSAQGYNRYSYVHNNPLNLTDPSGFEPCYADSGSCLEGGFTIHPEFDPYLYGQSTQPSGNATAEARSVPSPGSRYQAVTIPAFSYKQIQFDIAEKIAENNAIIQARNNLSADEEDDLKDEAEYRDDGKGGAAPYGYFAWKKNPQAFGHMLGVGQVVHAVEIATMASVAMKGFRLSLAIMRGPTVDAMAETGRVSGKLYGQSRLATLQSYLDKRGVDLMVGDEFLEKGQAAGFKIFTPGSGIRPQLLLGSSPTEYEVTHELAHYVHYSKIGPEAYWELPRATRWDVPEQAVFDMLEHPARWQRLNPEEQAHAIRYINGKGFR